MGGLLFLKDRDMIGVLAYGSLITNPGPELQAVTVGRIDNVLTPFRVEFARSSTGRSGAPTLVPVDEGGAYVRAVILEVNVSTDEAADIVYRREINKAGSGKRYREYPSTERASFGLTLSRAWRALIWSFQRASTPTSIRLPQMYLPSWRSAARGR